MQTDLGLGKLSYLIWLDYFNLIQLMLVLICVAETIIVHQRIKRSEVVQGMYIDRTCAIVLPYGVYTIVTLGTIIAFKEETRHLGILIMCFGGPVPALVGGMMYMGLSKRLKRQEETAINEFLTHDAYQDRAGWEKACTAMFHVVDIDGSGGLDEEEFRRVLQMIYPSMDLELRTACMEIVGGALARNVGQLSLGAFVESMLKVTENINNQIGKADSLQLTTDSPRLAGLSNLLEAPASVRSRVTMVQATVSSPRSRVGLIHRRRGVQSAKTSAPEREFLVTASKVQAKVQAEADEEADDEEASKGADEEEASKGAVEDMGGCLTTPGTVGSQLAASWDPAMQSQLSSDMRQMLIRRSPI